MEPFKPFPQCVDCLMDLAKQAATMAGGHDSRLLADSKAAARSILADAEQRGLTSPEAANRILREIKRRSGASDLYAQFKAREMAQAKKIFSELRKNMGDDLRSRINLAALGNSLDFFTNAEEVLAEIPGQIRRGLSFFHDDIARLESFLSNGPPSLVLYLADNAGEVYFDQPLYDYLKDRAGRTVLVVKGGPSLNDVTRAELRLGNLEGNFVEVGDTGTDGVGIDWDHVSREFLHLVDQADLILAKGMANFETIYPRDLSCPVFFLFKAKCQPIQDYLEAPGETYWALWKEGKPKGKTP
ncbi:MAG TPA: ARMT1-like domain-containing protein [Desulfatiglandales bacterium]|nr:ARMT1-like domain-containing protein [Desulfatiglandales bacterium]